MSSFLKISYNAWHGVLALLVTVFMSLCFWFSMADGIKEWNHPLANIGAVFMAAFIAWGLQHFNEWQQFKGVFEKNINGEDSCSGQLDKLGHFYEDSKQDFRAFYIGIMAGFILSVFILAHL